MSESVSKWKWLAVSLGGIAVWSIAKNSGAIGTALIIGDKPGGEDLAPALVGLITLPIFFVGLVLLYRWIRQRLGDLGLSADDWLRDALIGALVGGIQAGFMLAVLIPLVGKDQESVLVMREMLNRSPVRLMGWVLSGWLVGAAAEELFFRGHLIYSLRNLFGEGRWAYLLASVISGGLFVIAHRYQGWLGMTTAGISAAIFTGLFAWRTRLTSAIIAHGIYDTCIFVGIYLLYP